MGGDKDLFNQSFDFFHTCAEEKHGKAWSSPTFVFDPAPVSQRRHPLPVTFCPPTEHAEHHHSTRPSSRQMDLHVSVHERLTMTCDLSGSAPKSTIEGNVHLRRPNQIAVPFCLILRDSSDQLERLLPHTNVEDISRQIHQGPGKVAGFQRSDRIVKVSLVAEHLETSGDEEILVARYSCVPQLRPVPLLVKNRLHISDNSCRAAFKLRSNPSNTQSLAQLVAIMAVPSQYHGESAKLSPTGGVWDEMKRTITWCIDRIDPGEAVELQVQFDQAGERSCDTSGHLTPQFPLLVRADCAELFSKVLVLSDFCDSNGKSCRAEVSYSGKVLHRKL